MVYAVDQTKVATQVQKFAGQVLKSWNACLAEIAINPYPRFGSYVDRVIPIRGFPMRTWVYEIAQDTSISGQDIFIFTGDFFPEYAPVYVVYEERKEVVMIRLRDNHRA